MSESAKRDNPRLWEQCKIEAVEKMNGKFSARAMQLAVKFYKEKGGGYLGPKTKDNSLTKWTEEDWNYVGEEGKSRYLPKKARKALSSGEKAATSRVKNRGTKKGEQWVKQPESIAKKVKKYRSS